MTSQQIAAKLAKMTREAAKQFPTRTDDEHRLLAIRAMEASMRAREVVGTAPNGKVAA